MAAPANPKAHRWLWFGGDLFTRQNDVNHAYGVWAYDTMPPIAIDPAFQNLKTFQDLLQHLKAQKGEFEKLFFTEHRSNCTFMSVEDEDFEPGPAFLTDYAHLPGFRMLDFQVEEGTGLVFVSSTSPDRKYYVAQTLPEFLSRLKIENELWLNGVRSISKNRKPTALQRAYLDHLLHHPPKDMKEAIAADEEHDQELEDARRREEEKRAKAERLGYEEGSDVEVL